MDVEIKVITGDPSKLIRFEEVIRQMEADERRVKDRFFTTHCKNISSALAQVDGEKASCFVFFLLPGEDCFDDIRRIRLHKDFLFAPVIVIGQDRSTENVAEYIRHGVLTYIPEEDFNTDFLWVSLNKASEKMRIWKNLKGQQRKKNDQLAIVSHDLKGPLAIIKTYMDILLDDPQYKLCTAAREKIGRARHNAVLAHALVVDILDEFRAKKNWRMDFARLSLSSLLEEVLEAMKLRLEEKKIELRFKVIEGVDVFADKKSMLQLFSNVLDNAVKFSPPGSEILITVRPHQSALPQQGKVKEYASIVIADQGEGIPDHKLKVVFDSFNQARDKDKNMGFGLGLSICKRICQFHMGRIWATQRTVGGTSVHILLPSFSDYENATRSSDQAIAPPLPSPTIYRARERKHILVIDDLKDIRDITRQKLLRLGFEVSTAKNGLEGLDFCEKSDPDLILLDLNMPLLSGDLFLKELRSSGKAKSAVFIYSILKSESIFASSLRKADGFIQKPLEVEEFISKTKIHLGWSYLEKKGASKVVGKQHAETSSVKEEVCAGARLLLVDDNRDNHDILRYHLHRTNFKLDSAFNGKECVEKLKEGAYDAVIMDLVIPGADGYEITKIIRDNSLIPETTPVFAFTVDEIDLGRGDLERSGFNGVLRKPVDLVQLTSFINQFAKVSTGDGYAVGGAENCDDVQTPH